MYSIKHNTDNNNKNHINDNNSIGMSWHDQDFESIDNHQTDIISLSSSFSVVSHTPTAATVIVPPAEINDHVSMPFSFPTGNNMLTTTENDDFDNDNNNDDDASSSKWDIVSESHSIMSINDTINNNDDVSSIAQSSINKCNTTKNNMSSTFTTYRDVLMANPIPFPPCRRKVRSIVRKRLAPVMENDNEYDSDNNDDGLDFDSTFIMEGVKLARGGKLHLMFKGNPKTNKRKKK